MTLLNRYRVWFNFLIIIMLSLFTFWWTFFIFHRSFQWEVTLTVIAVRLVASRLLFKDYSLSWSKATQRTFIIKSFVYIIAFLIYMPLFYTKVETYLLLSELFTYLFLINFLMYAYYFYVHKNSTNKTKEIVIYGAGMAGLKLEEEFRNSEYRVKYFIDDNKALQGRSIDAVNILSIDSFKKRVEDNKLDLLLIAIPSVAKERVKEVYYELKDYFLDVKILPSLKEQLYNTPNYQNLLQDVSVEDLLAREPKDLDTKQIAKFIKNKTVLITGAGGSIGSELARQCIKFGAKKLILLDNSEYNLYKIEQELQKYNIVPVMQDVSKKTLLEKTFKEYNIDIVLHAAAYKHVPLVEENIEEAIINNILGTKNVIDLAIENRVKKFVLISTDKAVRPTNVMGTTKRVCELYAQNVEPQETEIVGVRFGNVLGSSGSVIPKFKEQIQAGGPVTVTHPDITRYFMLIPEACQLVLQAASIGKGGEIFVLDMGEPIKIANLAKEMIRLYGKENEVKIEFTGLRPGEKLYEELLIDESEQKTEYDSIMIGKVTKYDIVKLNKDIEELLACSDKLFKLKEIVPDFKHQMNR